MKLALKGQAQSSNPTPHPAPTPQPHPLYPITLGYKTDSILCQPIQDTSGDIVGVMQVRECVRECIVGVMQVRECVFECVRVWTGVGRRAWTHVRDVPPTKTCALFPPPPPPPPPPPTGDQQSRRPVHSRRRRGVTHLGSTGRNRTQERQELPGTDGRSAQTKERD